MFRSKKTQFERGGKGGQQGRITLLHTYLKSSQTQTCAQYLWLDEQPRYMVKGLFKYYVITLGGGGVKAKYYSITIFEEGDRVEIVQFSFTNQF